MGIVADNETDLKNKVMEATLVPLASLANLMGWGWAGGCKNFVGQGFDRTDKGWQAHVDGACGNDYMGNIRLGIDYADWGFEIVKLLWDPPTQSEVTPAAIDSGVLDNWESDQKKTQTVNLKVLKTAVITDTKTHTFTFSSETDMSVGYQPPSVTGGITANFTEKLTFGTSDQSSQSTSKTESLEQDYTVTGDVPAFARAPWSLIMSRQRSSATYTAVFRAKFSVQFRGFLRWGGDDPNGLNTNYHQDYAGKGDRPITDTKDWAKFGNATTPFADDLLNKVNNRIVPWQWQRLLTQHPDAQGYIDVLTDPSAYQFTITGRVDNVEGLRFDTVFGATEYNPAHAHGDDTAGAEAAAQEAARPLPVLVARGQTA